MQTTNFQSCKFRVSLVALECYPQIYKLKVNPTGWGWYKSVHPSVYFTFQFLGRKEMSMTICEVPYFDTYILWISQKKHMASYSSLWSLVTIHDQDNASSRHANWRTIQIKIQFWSLESLWVHWIEFLSLDHCQLRRIIGICAAISTYDYQTWKYENSDMSSFTVTPLLPDMINILLWTFVWIEQPASLWNGGLSSLSHRTSCLSLKEA